MIYSGTYMYLTFVNSVNSLPVGSLHNHLTSLTSYPAYLCDLYDLLTSLTSITSLNVSFLQLANQSDLYNQLICVISATI